MTHVVRALVVLAMIAGTAIAAPTRARPLEYFSDALSTADAQALDGELRAMQSRVAMAVIVVEWTSPTPIETYARAAAEAWSDGATPAAVLVVAVYDRRVRLEVSDALRARLPDERARAIIERSIEQLRAGDHAGAVRAVVAEVRAAAGVGPELELPPPPVERTTEVAPAPTPPAAAPPSSRGPSAQTIVIAIVILAGVIGLGTWIGLAGRKASATITHHGPVHLRSAGADILWGIIKVIAGVAWIALIFIAARSNSRREHRAFGSWIATDGGNRPKQGGGWSGGGASGSW